MLLVREAVDGLEPRVGRIVEVEAYGGEQDLASHARFGRTTRNAPMYGPAGRAYVYLVYGMHACLNVVTGPEGDPAAVLIRAVEPLEGIAAMRAARTRTALQRGASRRDAAVRRRLAEMAPTRLAAGPGLVCAAFGITPGMSGLDLLASGGELRLAEDGTPAQASAETDTVSVVAAERVGIQYAPAPWRQLPWRFFLRGHPSVSRPAQST